MLANACCCPESCVIEKDDFNRNNNTNIGGKFIEVSGNPGIVSNELSGTGAYLVVTSQSHISEQMSVRATLIHPGSAVTESMAVVVNYLDSNNYLYVRFDFVWTGIGVPVRTDMRFFRRSGGVASQLGSTRILDASTPLTNLTVQVCYDGTYLKAMGHMEAATKITAGFKAGMQYFGTLTARFDNFIWYKWGGNCPNCQALATCNICSDSIGTSLVLDVGAGGLSDSAATCCDSISGEYGVQWQPLGTQYCCVGGGLDNGCLWVSGGCVWAYQSGCGTVTGLPATLCIYVRLFEFGVNAYKRWQAFIFLHPNGSAGTAYFAVYSKDTTSVNCNTLPVTLDKTSEGSNIFGVTGCTGTLPATVELRALT